jgi:anti-anti-sigma factor
LHYAISNSDNAVVATISERFTFPDHSAFRAMTAELIANGAQRVVLNLSGVTFIDSSALGMLLLAREECLKHHKSLALRNPSGQVEQVLLLAKFDLMFSIERS